MFRASDGWFAIGVGTSGQWEKMVDALSLSVPSLGMKIELGYKEDEVERMVRIQLENSQELSWRDCYKGFLALQ